MQSEFELVATRPHGVVQTETCTTLEQALTVARGLALAGWVVHVRELSDEPDAFDIVVMQGEAA